MASGSVVVLPDPRELAATRVGLAAMRLLEAKPESLEALRDVMVIFEQLGVLARTTLQSEFPCEHDASQIESRFEWEKIVFFLTSTGIFPGLENMLIGLAELDRGRHPESLKPFTTGKGSGSRTTYEELFVHKRVVEAADRLKDLCVKDAERETRLKACGTNGWTIERYREACAQAAPPFWVEAGAYSYLGLDDTEILIKGLIVMAKDLRAHRPRRSQAE